MATQFTDLFWQEGTPMLILPWMILCWHLSKMETSTSYFEITFWLVGNIRSIHGIELFITYVGLSMTCVYPADDVRESIS